MIWFDRLPRQPNCAWRIVGRSAPRLASPTERLPGANALETVRPHLGGGPQTASSSGGLGSTPFGRPEEVLLVIRGPKPNAVGPNEAPWVGG